MSERIVTLDVQLGATLQNIGRLGGKVCDISDQHLGSDEKSDMQVDAQQELRSNWERVRDTLEAIAADKATDGRRRAKYSRIDRRRYGDLIDALDADGLLKRHEALFFDALNLWQKFRNGRLTPSAADVTRMRDIATAVEKLTPV